MNSLGCLFDSLISARPASFGHFWLPLTFGAFYLLVNLLFWVGGGLGLCKIHCVSSGSSLNVTNYSFARPAGVPVAVQACNEPPPCDTLVKTFPLHFSPVSPDWSPGLRGLHLPYHGLELQSWPSSCSCLCTLCCHSPSSGGQHSPSA